MRHYRTELGQVIYNPETRAYEALVSFHEGADIIRVPCSLAFPMDAERHVVASALIRQAREKRRQTRVPLMSRLRGAPLRPGGLERHIAARPKPAAPSLGA